MVRVTKANMADVQQMSRYLSSGDKMTHRELFFPAQLLLVLGIVHLDTTLDSLFDRHLSLALAACPLRSNTFGLTPFLLGSTQTFTLEPFLAESIVRAQR